MPISYRSVDVRCPYYHHDDKISIRCEGVGGSVTATLRFPSGVEKNQHMIIFCNSYHFRRCELCRAIEEKYPDEDLTEEAIKARLPVMTNKE